MSVRSEDKRKLKNVLYHLLEVHHLFLRSDFGVVIIMVKDKIHQLIPAEELSPQADAFLTSIYTAFAQKLVTEDVARDFKRLEAGYVESIKNLSQVEPLIAYRLSGRTSIYETMESLSSHMSGRAELFQTDKSKYDSEIKQVADMPYEYSRIRIASTELQFDLYHVDSTLSHFFENDRQMPLDHGYAALICRFHRGYRDHPMFL